MKKGTLYFLTYLSMIIFFGVLACLIFIPAGDWSFMMGWGFWLSFCCPTLLITAYFLKADPALIQRRILPTESRPRQIIGQSVAGLLFAALIVVPALDHRLGWTGGVPGGISLLFDLLIVAGFILVFQVFRVNTFASRAIETMDNQRVIKTGPYSKVRHPMYSGAALIIWGIPPALGSWAGLGLSAALTAVIVLRILDEEKLLIEELEGYREYRKEVKYRLFPLVW